MQEILAENLAPENIQSLKHLDQLTLFTHQFLKYGEKRHIIPKNQNRLNHTIENAKNFRSDLSRQRAKQNVSANLPLNLFEQKARSTNFVTDKSNRQLSQNIILGKEQLQNRKQPNYFHVRSKSTIKNHGQNLSIYQEYDEGHSEKYSGTLAPPLPKRFQQLPQAQIQIEVQSQEKRRYTKHIVNSTNMDIIQRPSSKQTLQKLNKVFTSAFPRPAQHSHWQSTSVQKQKNLNQDRSGSPKYKDRVVRDKYSNIIGSRNGQKVNIRSIESVPQRSRSPPSEHERATDGQPTPSKSNQKAPGLRENNVYRQLKTNLPLKPKFTMKGDIIYKRNHEQQITQNFKTNTSNANQAKARTRRRQYPSQALQQQAMARTNPDGARITSQEVVLQQTREQPSVVHAQSDDGGQDREQVYTSIEQNRTDDTRLTKTISPRSSLNNTMGNSSNFVFQPQNCDSDQDMKVMQRESLELDEIQKNLNQQQSQVNKLIARQEGLQVLAQSTEHPNTTKYVITSPTQENRKTSDGRGSSLKVSLENEIFEIEKQKILIEQQINELELKDIDKQISNHEKNKRSNPRSPYSQSRDNLRSSSSRNSPANIDQDPYRINKKQNRRNFQSGLDFIGNSDSSIIQNEQKHSYKGNQILEVHGERSSKNNTRLQAQSIAAAMRHSNDSGFSPQYPDMIADVYHKYTATSPQSGSAKSNHQNFKRQSQASNSTVVKNDFQSQEALPQSKIKKNPQIGTNHHRLYHNPLNQKFGAKKCFPMPEVIPGKKGKEANLARLMILNNENRKGNPKSRRNNTTKIKKDLKASSNTPGTISKNQTVNNFAPQIMKPTKALSIQRLKEVQNTIQQQLQKQKEEKFGNEVIQSDQDQGYQQYNNSMYKTQTINRLTDDISQPSEISYPDKVQHQKTTSVKNEKFLAQRVIKEREFMQIQQDSFSKSKKSVILPSELQNFPFQNILSEIAYPRSSNSKRIQGSSTTNQQVLSPNQSGTYGGTFQNSQQPKIVSQTSSQAPSKHSQSSKQRPHNFKLSPIPSLKSQKLTQAERAQLERERIDKQQKYEKLMKFDAQLDDKIHDIDTRLKKLERMTNHSYENKSDSRKSQKTFKQVQFSNTRRNSSEIDKDDILNSLKSKPDQQASDRQRTDQQKSEGKQASPDYHADQKGLSLRKQNTTQQTNSPAKKSNQSQSRSPTRQPAPLQKKPSKFSKQSPYRPTPPSAHFGAGDSVMHKAVRFDLNVIQSVDLTQQSIVESGEQGTRSHPPLLDSQQLQLNLKEVETSQNNNNDLNILATSSEMIQKSNIQIQGGVASLMSTSSKINQDSSAAPLQQSNDDQVQNYSLDDAIQQFDAQVHQVTDSQQVVMLEQTEVSIVEGTVRQSRELELQNVLNSQEASSYKPMEESFVGQISNAPQLLDSNLENPDDRAPTQQSNSSQPEAPGQAHNIMEDGGTGCIGTKDSI